MPSNILKTGKKNNIKRFSDNFIRRIRLCLPLNLFRGFGDPKVSRFDADILLLSRFDFFQTLFCKVYCLQGLRGCVRQLDLYGNFWYGKCVLSPPFSKNTCCKRKERNRKNTNKQYFTSSSFRMMLCTVYGFSVPDSDNCDNKQIVLNMTNKSVITDPVAP